MGDIKSKIDYIVTSLSGKSVEPKAGSVLSAVSEILINPASKDFHDGTNMVAKTIAKELKFYKNTVLKEVNSNISFIHGALNDNYIDDTPKSFVVKQIAIPEFVSLLLDRNTIRDVAGVSMSDVKLTIPLPDNVKDYTLFGAGELGVYVKDYVSSKDEGHFENVWYKYLTDLSLDNIEMMRLVNSGLTKTVRNYDDIFSVYILVRSLLKNPPASVKGNLDAYESGLKLVEKKLSSAIFKRSEKFFKMSSNETVVIERDGNDVFVISGNYVKLLSKDISIESVFGGTLNTSGTLSVKDIITNHEEFAKNWNDHYSKSVVESKLAVEKRLKMILATNFNKQLPEFIKNHYIPKDLTVDDLSELTTKFLGSVGIVSRDNLDKIIKEYVIHVLFCFTNASVFFGYVETYTGKTFNLDLDQAISYAMLEMIIDFYANEVEVTKK